MSLPSGYKKLQYIESSGTQYIDTGVSGGTNAAYEIKFNPLSLRIAYEMYFAGSRTATIPKLYGQNTGLTIEVGSTFITQLDYLNADHVVTVNADGTVLYDGTILIGFPSFAGVGWGDSTWWVCNAHEEPTLQASMRLYGLKMWTDDILVRDYIPCRSADGTVGLWDDVNLVFYGNSGSGTFIAGPPINIKTGDIFNYDYTGAVQSITLLKGVYKLEVWGAQGGDANATYALGGRGGYSCGIISLNKKEDIFIYVGQAGPVPSSNVASSPAFNGGGYGNLDTTTSIARISSGGGASDIRIGTDSLYSRVIVAGGGGGSGYISTSQHANGGAGGGENGEDGKYYTASSSYARQGYGGTQTEGGKNGYSTSGNYGLFGQGGNDITTSQAGGGGGGGWYGGGAADGYYAGGGGGSGFVWTGSNAPSGYLLGSEYYLTDASTIAGNASMPSISGGTETGHTGNGYARITAIKVGSLNLPVNIGGTWKDANEAYVNIGSVWKTVEAVYANIDGLWKELA